ERSDARGRGAERARRLSRRRAHAPLARRARRVAAGGVSGRAVQPLPARDAPCGGEELMRTAFDAVIVGAGPAGSSAAILLARAGWSVALIEKQAFPRRKVCGECIAASNLPLLDALGVGGAFA